MAVARRTDEQISEQVASELAWDHRVDATGIAVTVADGEVTLTGQVPTYAQRNLATGAAESIAGVTVVHNHLTVGAPTPAPTDRQIRRNAQSLLNLSATVDSAAIDVSVVQGTVRLEGHVETGWEKWRAEEMVADLNGVVAVENHLTVVPSDRVLDEEIAKSIEEALERNLYIPAEAVNVKVERGIVTLSGTLPTFHARRQAYATAMRTFGVVDVINDIAVVA